MITQALSEEKMLLAKKRKVIISTDQKAKIFAKMLLIRINR